MVRKLRVFAWFNFLTPPLFLPFHSFPSHGVFLRHITVHRSLTLPNPNSFSPPYSTLVLIPLLSPFLPLPIFSSYSLNPRPGTSLLRWSHSLPPSFTPPTDLPLSSSRFFLSPSILLLPTPLLIFSVPLPSHPTPLPFPSSLLLLHVLLLLQTFPIFFYSFSFPLLSSYSPFSFFHTLHPSYRSSPIFLHSFSFPPPSFSFPPLSSYSPFASLHTIHPSHSPPSSHYSMSFLLLQTFPYLPSLFFLSPSIVLLPTPLFVFSVPVPPYLAPLPFPSSLSLPHVLPPPTDHPLSSLLSLLTPPFSCPLRSPMPYFPHAFPFCSFFYQNTIVLLLLLNWPDFQ